MQPIIRYSCEVMLLTLYHSRRQWESLSRGLGHAGVYFPSNDLLLYLSLDQQHIYPNWSIDAHHQFS
jgi:hypothetical protein